MEKQYGREQKQEIEDYIIDSDLILLSEYCNFNLRKMADKIKLQTYRPKPKMLYL